jgi:hypothetical protein
LWASGDIFGKKIFMDRFALFSNCKIPNSLTVLACVMSKLKYFISMFWLSKLSVSLLEKAMWQIREWKYYKKYANIKINIDLLAIGFGKDKEIVCRFDKIS